MAGIYVQINRRSDARGIDGWDPLQRGMNLHIRHRDPERSDARMLSIVRSKGQQIYSSSPCVYLTSPEKRGN